MRSAAILLAGLLAAGCGLRTDLEPPPGGSLPPRPAMANTPLTPEEMLTPPPLARPDRVDELLRRSEPRQEDRFALPPGDVATGVVSVPPPAPPGAEDEPDEERPD